MNSLQEKFLVIISMLLLIPNAYGMDYAWHMYNAGRNRAADALRNGVAHVADGVNNVIPDAHSIRKGAVFSAHAVKSGAFYLADGVRIVTPHAIKAVSKGAVYSYKAARYGAEQAYVLYQGGFGGNVDANAADHANIDQIMADAEAQQAAGVNPLGADVVAPVVGQVIGPIIQAADLPQAIVINALGQAVPAAIIDLVPVNGAVDQLNNIPAVQAHHIGQAQGMFNDQNGQPIVVDDLQVNELNLFNGPAVQADPIVQAIPAPVIPIAPMDPVINNNIDQIQPGQVIVNGQNGQPGADVAHIPVLAVPVAPIGVIPAAPVAPAARVINPGRPVQAADLAVNLRPVAPVAPVARVVNPGRAIQAADLAVNLRPVDPRAPIVPSFWQRSKQLITNHPKKSALIVAATMAAAGIIAYKTNTKFRNKVDATVAKAKTKAQEGVAYAKDRWNKLRNQEITKADVLRMASVIAAGGCAYKLYTTAKQYGIQDKLKRSYHHYAWHLVGEHKKATAAAVGGAVIAGAGYALFNKYYAAPVELTKAQKAYKEFQDMLTTSDLEAIKKVTEVDPTLHSLIVANNSDVAAQLLHHALFVELLSEQQKAKLAYAASMVQ